ncbi:MAG: flagellar biosynthesis anti-sigma factor FlgM [Tepidiformaceae bacterium]
MTRIDGLNPLSTSRTTSGMASAGVDSDERAAAGAAGAGGRQDVLSVSNRGRVMAVAASAVAQSRDVRSEKIATLKAAIADGSYKSNAREIASRLVADGLGGAD